MASASASNTSISIASLTPPIPETVTHINISVSTKLDRTNFLTWRSQIEPIIDGFDLTSHLDPDFSPPAKDLVVEGAIVRNPAFLAWHKQDRLLLGWLRSTISGSVLAQYVKCQTATALWSDLHQVYSAISSARIMELRRLLQTTTRGGKSCNEYLETMREITDQLSASGDPVLDSDLVRYVLNGLGPDFNSFVVALTTRSDPVSLGDLHGYLLSHKTLINSQHLSSQSFVSDPLAFYSST